MSDGYLVDTNIFGRILDGNILTDNLPKGPLHATQVQNYELKKTKDEHRRADLKDILDNLIVVENRMVTETIVWGDPEIHWGDSRVPWGNDGDLYQDILNRLDQLNNKKSNNQWDALIAETAIVKKLCLVSCDKDLIKVSREFGCTVYNPDESKVTQVGGSN